MTETMYDVLLEVYQNICDNNHDKITDLEIIPFDIILVNIFQDYYFLFELDVNQINIENIYNELIGYINFINSGSDISFKDNIKHFIGCYIYFFNISEFFKIKDRIYGDNWEKYKSLFPQ